MTESVDSRVLARLSPAGLAFHHGILSGRPYAVPPHVSLLDGLIVSAAVGELQAQGYRGLIATTPPRHGKSELFSRFTPAWYLGAFPLRSVVLASYEADFAMSWGRKAREVLELCGPEVFGVRVDRRSSAASSWRVLPSSAKRAGEHGEMHTAGIGGAITGRGADLLIIDDPVKNAAEAHSRTRRESQWTWLTSTALTRLEPGGFVLLVMTRWHEDDVAGRLLESMADGGDQYLAVNLPAISDGDADPIGRIEGEPLWPERWSLAELESRRRALGSYVWNALYQGKPTDASSGMFDTDWLRVVDAPRADAKRSARVWDFASTEGAGDYTAGVLVQRLGDSSFLVADVRRGRWSADGVDAAVLDCAALDGRSTKIRILQERGAAGRLVVQRFKRLLPGHDVKGLLETGEKEVRARPMSAAAERGDLELLRARWTDAFIEEAVRFPRGVYDDQVDAAAAGVAELEKVSSMQVL